MGFYAYVNCIYIINEVSSSYDKNELYNNYQLLRIDKCVNLKVDVEQLNLKTKITIKCEQKYCGQDAFDQIQKYSKEKLGNKLERYILTYETGESETYTFTHLSLPNQIDKHIVLENYNIGDCSCVDIK